MNRGREEGAGTALVVGIAAAVVLVFALLVPVTLVLVARQRAAAAADAAALAGADTALGLSTGVPCDRAREAASAAGALLTGCRQRDDLVRVAVAVPVAGLRVAAQAVAGPPS